MIAEGARRRLRERRRVQVLIQGLRSIHVVADLVGSLSGHLVDGTKLPIERVVAAGEDGEPRPRACGENPRHSPIGPDNPEYRTGKPRRLISHGQIGDVRLVLRAVALIEGEVVRLGRSRRELMVAVVHAIAEAVRPCVVAIEAHAACRHATRRELESAIVRYTVVVEDLEVANLTTDRWI